MKTSSAPAHDPWLASVGMDCDTFVARHWERRPLHVKAPAATAPTTLKDVRSLLRNVVADYQRTDRPPYFVDDEVNQVSRQDLLRGLPTPRDRSGARYLERVKRDFAGKSFTMIVMGCQRYSWELMRSCAALLAPLNERVGLGPSAHITLYLSKTRSTGFGIHQDPVSNFLFVLHGRKRFRLWSEAFMRKHRDYERARGGYEPILHGALTFDLGPGDLLYIPSEYYHIAEATRDELTLQVSLLIGTDPVANVMELVSTARAQANDRCAERFRQSGIPAFHLPNPAGPAVVPSSVARGVAEAQAMIDAQLRRVWLGAMSGGGFLHVTPRRSAEPLGRKGSVIVPEGRSLLVEELDGMLVVAAQGHVHEAPLDERLARALARLATGEAVTLAALYREFVGADQSGRSKKETKPLADLLSALHAMRAIERVEPRARARAGR